MSSTTATPISTHLTSSSSSSPLTISSTYPLSSSSSSWSSSSNTNPLHIPVLGFGVYETPVQECESVCLHALRRGYRHIDSARMYRNEEPCADAIRNSGLRREEVWFTSKIGPREMGYLNSKKAIASTLKKTKLEYIDLFLIHAPYGGKDGRCGTWKALVEAQKEGKIRSIGVSNYGIHHLNELEEYIKSSDVGGVIDVGQWEIHPWLPREDLVEWARNRGVAIQAWSPLVRAQRSHEPVLKKIGEKHGKTWAQVLIRWSLQKGYIPLPKSVHPERIDENADVYDFELDDEDMKALEFPGSYEPCGWDTTKEHY